MGHDFVSRLTHASQGDTPMWFRSALGLLSSRTPHTQNRHSPKRRPPTRRRMRLEPLEDRCLLSLSVAGDYAMDHQPTDIVAADFNRDGRPDLATLNADYSVSLLLAEG